jgi:Protein of unknown function (DUF4242)
MPIYLVERDLPGMTRDQLAAAHRALIQAASPFTAQGNPVRLVRSIFMPQQARCMCVFEASDADVVRRLNDATQIPFVSVTEAIELTPPTSTHLESL